MIVNVENVLNMESGADLKVDVCDSEGVWYRGCDIVEGGRADCVAVMIEGRIRAFPINSIRFFEIYNEES